jgi:hypothetical protein
MRTFIKKWFYLTYAILVGGEIAYWLELKSFFDSENYFPYATSWNSVLLEQKSRLENRQTKFKLDRFVSETNEFN